MGLLSWLRGIATEASAPPININGTGDYLLEVVGEASYQDAISQICGGKTKQGHRKQVQALLVHDDANQHDRKAVRVDVAGSTVGYLSREHARKFRDQLTRMGHRGAPVACAAIIVGGWDRGNGNTGHFGVKLDVPMSAAL